MKLTLSRFISASLLCCLLLVGTLASGVQVASAQALPSHVSQSHTHAMAPLIGTGGTGCWSGGTHPDYLGIYTSTQGWSCFSGDGYIGFRIDGNAFIHSGNNNGWVRCYGGSCGSGFTKKFSAYGEMQLGNTLITQVDITGQG
jgi:hypothetical protein